MVNRACPTFGFLSTPDETNTSSLSKAGQGYRPKASVMMGSAHFEQAAGNVTEDQVTSTVTCGPDAEAYVEMIRRYADAGYDELFVAQVGPELEGFLRFYRAEVEPRL